MRKYHQHKTPNHCGHVRRVDKPHPVLVIITAVHETVIPVDREPDRYGKPKPVRGFPRGGGASSPDVCKIPSKTGKPFGWVKPHRETNYERNRRLLKRRGFVL